MFVIVKVSLKIKICVCVVKGDKVTATKFNKHGVTILLQRFYSNIFVSLNDAGKLK